MPLLILLLAVLSACSSAPKKVSEPAAPPAIETPLPDSGGEERIDYFGLQKFLRLERSKEALGYTERPFQTCETGYGFSRTHNCRAQTLSVIHIHLLCRDSDGTVSDILSHADLRPLGRRTLRWSLKGVNGTAETDSDGYAQIVTSSNLSQRDQRLRISIGNDFLQMRAKDMGKVVTPKNWCDLY